MQVTTINDQPTLLIDRPLTADTTPPAAVTDGMTTITTTPPTPAIATTPYHSPQSHHGAHSSASKPTPKP